jgi:hypothetical protein
MPKHLCGNHILDNGKNVVLHLTRHQGMWRDKSLWIGEFCYDEFVLLLGKIENKCPEKHLNQDPQPRSADFNQAQETTEPPQL